MKTFLLIVVVLFTSILWAEDCPMHAAHMQENMESRGDTAMGFDHDKTTHHFLITEEGGSIQVEANDARDETSRDAIRVHLVEVRTLFSHGDFDKPFFIHARTLPGIPQMKELKDQISYKYEDLDRGGKVSISSKNETAVSAIHEFLQAQIQDHHTGDPQ